MGSIGDEVHDAVANDLKKECQDVKTEDLAKQAVQQAHEADITEAKDLAIENSTDISEAHKDDITEVEDLATQNAIVNLEAQEDDITEVEDLATQNAIVNLEAHKDDITEVEDLATQNSAINLEAHDDDIHKAEAPEESVVDKLSQKLSAITVADTDDRDKVDSEPETDSPVHEVLPKVKRRLPEVKRFSARRSDVAEDPKTKGMDESMSPSTIRKQRSANRLPVRMNIGIDDRDTVDYGSATTEDFPKLVGAKTDTVKVVMSTPPKQQLSVAERERLRLLAIKRDKEIVCLERIRGKLVNITQGLELHTGVFSRVEQLKLTDLVKELQAKGRRRELKERTYSEPRKWMKGKGRVTMQFGCCYNYATDSDGNPPGILRKNVVDPIPPLLRTTIKRLVRWHVLPQSCVPDSCIINIYEEGDCIPPHIDHHDFLRPFCTLSLLSECSIVFGANLEILGPGSFGGNLALPLPVGSVLVLNGNGADVAKHAVPAVPTPRISITFRKMDPLKVPAGFTIDQELQNLKSELEKLGEIAQHDKRRIAKDNLGEVQDLQEVFSDDQMAGLSSIAETDDRGRVIRHLQKQVSIGGCAICKKWNLSTSGYVEGMTMLVCDQCGREYHVACLQNSGMDDLNVNELPEGEWFCQKDCKGIDEILTQLVANGPESLSGSTLVETRQLQDGVHNLQEKAENCGTGLEWQILCGKAGSTAKNKTLAEAVTIFTDCLDPIRDAKTGRNLIPLMVNSKRFKDYDFEGIFCVVLKLNEKVVSAALLQIFGREIAEIPLLATRPPNQRQGFCRAVVTTIERLLGVLSVKRLVLPTPENTEPLWVNKFGFIRMEDQQLSETCTTTPLLTFTGTKMLEKPIIPINP